MAGLVPAIHGCPLGTGVDPGTSPGMTVASVIMSGTFAPPGVGYRTGE
jgi:hypothetical protein